MFSEDSRVANWLTHLGVQFKYVDDIKYNSLEPTWEQQNLGRSQAKKDEAILEYASRMEAGSAAPAPIIHPTGRGNAVLDGVQRLCAWSFLGGTSFPAYVVTSDSLLSTMKIRVLANHILAGHPEPTEWSRKRAIQMLVIEGGMSMEEVARLGGWTLKSVQDDKLHMDYNSAIIHVGGPSDLGKGIVLKIAEAAKLDDFRLAAEPVAAFCRDLKEGRFTNGESEPFIRAFFKVPRKDRGAVHDIFVENLEDFRSHPEIEARLQGRRNSRLAPDVKLRKAFRVCLTIISEMVDDGAYIPYVEEYHQIWSQVDEKIKQLAKTRRKQKA